MDNIAVDNVAGRGTEPDGLVLELGEGFSGNDVVVLLDGQEVWHRTGVTTNYSVGRAAVIRLPRHPSRAATLEVRAGASTTSHRVQAGADEVRLRASVDSSGVVRIGPAPEGYRF
ncbi:MAG: hypothetical protein ACT4NP_12810 [Pseudonocardiales bacterium]